MRSWTLHVAPEELFGRLANQAAGAFSSLMKHIAVRQCSQAKKIQMIIRWSFKRASMKKNMASIDVASGAILTRTALKEIEKRKYQVSGMAMSVKDMFVNDDLIIGVVEYPHGGVMLQKM